MTNKNVPKTKIIWSGFFLRLFVLLVLITLGYGGLLLFNLNRNIKKTTLEHQDPANANNLIALTKSTISKDKIKLKGADTDRINILLLGIGGVEHKGKYLTDTIALVSINPRTYQSAILSIPRDLYVQIPGSSYHTKINALYTYGMRNKDLSSEESVKLIAKAVEEITNENVHYHAILDFAGFKEIIEVLDGVNVEVENDIYDTRYPGPNCSYQTFEIDKGFHHLNAETALKYARVRHTKGGDFGRAYRQQQIIASAREKALSLRILANPVKIIKLMNALGDHLKTNISVEEMPAMISLIKDINIHQATTKVLDAWSKDSLLRSTHVPLGGVSAYVLRPKGKGYAQIHQLSENIFDLGKLEEFRGKIKKEDARISLLTSDYATFGLFKKTLSEWGYKITTPHSKTNYKKYCEKNKDTILSYTGNEKIFTLNDFAGRLDTEVDYEEQVGTIKKEDVNNNTLKDDKKYNYDIVLCITANTAKYFHVNEEINKQSDEVQKVLNDEGEAFINEELIIDN